MLGRCAASQIASASAASFFCRFTNGSHEEHRVNERCQLCIGISSFGFDIPGLSPF
jgi:hypothetical protein